MLTPRARIKENLMLLSIIRLYFQGLECDLLSLKATFLYIYKYIGKIRFTDA